MKSPRKTKTQRILEGFATAAPPILDRSFTPDRCVNATWILRGVLKHFHLEVTPLCVEVFAVNKAFMDRFDMLRRFPQTPAEIQEWFDANGSHSVGTIRGTRLRPQSFMGGHLVGLVGKWLVDPSAGQFTRPQHRMRFPPIIVAATDEEFRRGERRLVILDENQTIMYTAFPEDRSHEDPEVVGFQNSPENIRCETLIKREMWKMRLG